MQVLDIKVRIKQDSIVETYDSNRMGLQYSTTKVDHLQILIDLPDIFIGLSRHHIY